ncbi:hypothetical protein ABGF38_05270, partial [Helcococcus ovis]
MKINEIKNIIENRDDYIKFKNSKYDFFKEDSEYINLHFSNTNTIENPYKHIMLNVENKNRYTIDGNEAELVFHGDVNTFLIKNCCDITIKNLTIDYYNPT